MLVAPQGLGKTMIAQNIAHEAILAGHSVLFVTAAQLLLDLAAQDSARALDRRFRHYAKQSLLVIDEVGYLAFDNRNADLLFQVVARRYERKSLVLTTNLAFATGRPSSRTRPAPPRSSIASSTTPTSSPSRAELPPPSGRGPCEGPAAHEAEETLTGLRSEFPRFYATANTMAMAERAGNFMKRFLPRARLVGCRA